MFRETGNTKGLRLDAMRMTIVESRLGTFGGPEVGSDIVVLLGFMPGDLAQYEILPVVSIDQVISDCVDISDDAAVRAFKKTSIFKALVACQMHNGSNVVLFKLGDITELDELSGDDDATMQLIYDRLAEGMPIAADNEWFSYLVPVDAPAEGYTLPGGTFLDFLSLSADVCAKAMSYGLFMQALLSTREENGTLWMTSESLRRKEDWQFRDPEQSYCYSPTLGWIPGNDKYRFVAVPTGRAFFSSPEHEAFFEDGLAPAVAGLLSSLPTNVSITGRQLNVSEIKGPVLGSIADRLSVAGYMPVGQTDLMRKRRRSGALVLADNTMAVAGSDFKQEAVMRVARRVSLKIRLALERAIGGNGQNVQQIVENTLDEIVDQGAIKAYSFKVSRDPKDLSRMLVYLEVQPYLQVKVIEISIVTGPFIN